ncbi:MAG: zinc ribbon domain-containing protein [Gemmatimonadales bacterium]
MTTPTCPACSAPLTPGAKYCHRCGRAIATDRARERNAWIFAWTMVAVALGVIVYYVQTKDANATGPDMANAGTSTGADSPGGQPPDISQMTPRERFLRLHDRIMSAADKGDSATVTRFSPMALSAYGMLDSFDVDVRYHAGAIHLRLGDVAAARALADTIGREAPDNLLASLLLAEAAQVGSDPAGYDKARKSFLAHFDAQIRLNRPEYTEHRSMLDEIRTRFAQ